MKSKGNFDIQFYVPAAIVSVAFLGIAIAATLILHEKKAPIVNQEIVAFPDPVKEMSQSFAWLPVDSLQNHPRAMCGRVTNALDVLVQTMEQKVDFFSPRDSILPGDIQTYWATVEYLSQHCGDVAGKWSVGSPDSEIYRSGRFAAALH